MDDGTVQYLDESGRPLNEYLTTLAKRQAGPRIRDMLVDACERINADVESLGQLHRHTPRPDETPTRTKRPFNKAPQRVPEVQKVDLWSRIMGKAAQIEAQNAEIERRYANEFAKWLQEKAQFEQNEEALSRQFDRQLRSNPEFMQQVLEDNLQDIAWPRETLVSFDVQQSGTSIAIDVDLPEMEDLPRKVATVPSRGYKLNIKELKGKALNELYSRHVHSVGFRIIGEVFATLPTVKHVTLSAFTQRVDQWTGHTLDTYIYSVQVKRAAWLRIHFECLAEVDVVATFEQFELRRKFGRSGHLEPIVPFDAG